MDNTTTATKSGTSVSPGTFLLTMSDVLAATLNESFNTTSFKAGQALGTFTPTAIVE